MCQRRKKLIEVALPLEAISGTGCQQEKNPFLKGHPRNIQLWWARRPLAACRAVLFAQLVDDPDSDPAYRRPDGTVDEDAAGLKRAQLFTLIEELVKWQNSNNERIINAARAEIARCVASRLIEEGKLGKDTIIHGKNEGKPHPKGPLSGEFRTAWELIVHGHGDLEGLERRTVRLCPSEVVNHFLATYAPPVLDPFAGGGSIPLEAQRLGLRAYASDLNPVAVLINKALIEIPPKFANLPPVHPEAEKKTLWQGAEGLAEDVRRYGQWMRDEAARRIGHLYPKVKVTKKMAEKRPDLKDYIGQELTVIAWLWARTVKSSNPAFAEVHVPLVKSFWLSKKKGKEVWVKPIVEPANKTYRFEVQQGKPEGTNKTIAENATKLGRGCKFRCILSDSPIPEDYIKAEGMAGRMSNRLLAVVCEGTRGRIYVSPSPEMEAAARVPTPESDGINAPIAEDKRALWCLLYGLTHFNKLFTPRQLTALVTFSDLVGEARTKVLADAKAAGHLPDDDRGIADQGTGPQAYADAIVTYLALAVSQMTRYSSTLCGWNTTNENVAQVFGRQALPMVWDFAEANVVSGKLDIVATCEWESRVLEELIIGLEGFSSQQDARLPIPEGMIIATDPPYYDNIGYADLSDFFYVWLRRSLKNVYPQVLSTMLTPKAQEMIASPYRHDGSKAKAAAFFEKALGKTIAQWRQHSRPDFPTTIFYAFKQAETDNEGTASTGWETFLAGLIDHGFSIMGTWPIRTEREKGLKGKVNALASSVALSCTNRPDGAPMATRREFLSVLKQELPDAMKKLQIGNIAPVDLAQAAIGPGMAVFSRYSKVVESSGDPMTVRTALTLINQILDEVLAEQEGEFDSDTRWAVAWFEQHGMDEGPYGVAETLSKAKNTSVEGLVEAGLVVAQGGKVQLIDRDEMPEDWDPAADNRLTNWEATQHLIQRLQNTGERAAAELLARLGGDYGERARDLAYRLYNICDRKGWAQQALGYNSLIVAWPEISRLAQRVDSSQVAQEEGRLF